MAPCESPFATLDQIWHATRPANVLYAPDNGMAKQIESGFAIRRKSVRGDPRFLRGAVSFLDEGFPLRAFYYDPEGTGTKGDHGAWDPPLNMEETGCEPYEGWNRRNTEMEQGWHHDVSFDRFAIDRVRGRVGRPVVTRGRRTYLCFKITKKLLDMLHLERVAA